MNKEAIRLLEQLQNTLAHPEEEGRVRRRTFVRRNNRPGLLDNERYLNLLERSVVAAERLQPPPEPQQIYMGMGGDVPGGKFNPVPTGLPRTPGECVKGSNVASEFEKELSQLINRYSLENETNVPDFIVANYLIRCLEAFRHTVQWTHNWYEGSKWNNPYGTTSNLDQTQGKKDRE